MENFLRSACCMINLLRYKGMFGRELNWAGRNRECVEGGRIENPMRPRTFSSVSFEVAEVKRSEVYGRVQP